MWSIRLIEDGLSDVGGPDLTEGTVIIIHLQRTTSPKLSYSLYGFLP